VLSFCDEYYATKTLHVGCPTTGCSTATTPFTTSTGSHTTTTDINQRGDNTIGN